MPRRNYTYDENYDFRKERHPLVKALLTGVRWLLGSVVLACVYHAVLSLVLITDSDRELIRENRLYADMYQEMRVQERVLRDAVRSLELRDDEIYFKVFNTSAPSMSDLSAGNLASDDAEELEDKDIFSRSAARVARVEESACAVEDNFRRVFDLCAQQGYAMPPMTMPLEGFTLERTGAGVGMKVSPFYKVATAHDGLDLIAPVGTAVLSGGAGVVVKVQRSAKAEGNMVVIDHGNGYVTRYSHLADIKVSSGRKVKAGEKIGTVGMSGKSFAPHLHYSVMHGDDVCDPVNYMFSSISPQDYAAMLVLSGSIAQQMD